MLVGDRWRADGVIRPLRSKTPDVRLDVPGCGAYPAGKIGVLRLELACGVDDSGGRAVQALRHFPHIRQQLLGVRLELLGECQADIVVAPAAFGLHHTVPQTRIGLPHLITESGQPLSPISQTIRIQPDLSVHVPPRRSDSAAATHSEPSRLPHLFSLRNPRPRMTPTTSTYVTVASNLIHTS